MKFLIVLESLVLSSINLSFVITTSSFLSSSPFESILFASSSLSFPFFLLRPPDFLLASLPSFSSFSSSRKL